MSYMKEISKLLNVELDEVFAIDGKVGTFYLCDNGLMEIGVDGYYYRDDCTLAERRGYEMGTNFYWIEPPNEFKDNEILQHIGKRSAAGYYCDKCGISFCKGGTQSIHFSDIAEWYTECPVCGSKGIFVCSFTYTSMKQKEIIEKLINTNKKLIKDEYDKEFTPKEFLLDALSNTKIEYQMYAEFC